MAVFWEVYIREQEFKNVIHTYPSKPWDRGVCCLALVWEGIDWGHTVNLQLEQSQHASYFIVEWKNWLCCTMAVLPLWMNEQNKTLWGQGTWKGFKNGSFWVSCTWMSSKVITQVGGPPAIRSGGSSYWSICFTMQQLCEGENEKDTWEGAPPCSELTKPKKWPSTPLHQGPSKVNQPGDSGHGRTSVPGGVHASSQWTPLLAAGGIHGRAASRVGLTYG